MKIISIFVFGSSIRDEVTSLDMGGTGQKQLLLFNRSSCFVFFCIFVTIASFDAQARRRRLTREGQSSFKISFDKTKTYASLWLKV